MTHEVRLNGCSRGISEVPPGTVRVSEVSEVGSPLEGKSVNAPAGPQKYLIQTLIEEASDVDLVCYLAHSGGAALLKDLFECIRDAESLPPDDISYNINLIRQKKVEASKYPMYLVFRSLMKQPSIEASLDAASVSSRGKGFGELRGHFKGNGLSTARH